MGFFEKFVEMIRIIRSPFTMRSSVVLFARRISTPSMIGAITSSKFKHPLPLRPTKPYVRCFASEGDEISPIESKIIAVEHDIMKVDAAINDIESEIKIEKLRDPCDKESLQRLYKEKEQLRKEKEQLRKKEEQLRKKEELLLKASLSSKSSSGQYLRFYISLFLYNLTFSMWVT